MPDFAIQAVVHSTLLSSNYSWDTGLPTFYLHNTTEEDARVNSRTLLTGYDTQDKYTRHSVEITIEEV